MKLTVVFLALWMQYICFAADEPADIDTSKTGQITFDIYYGNAYLYAPIYYDYRPPCLEEETQPLTSEGS